MAHVTGQVSLVPPTSEPEPSGTRPRRRLDLALARNHAFAAAGAHEGASVFPALGLFVVTCLDPRVDPAHFLGLELSDAVVVRNVGGRVTREVIDDIAFIGQIAESVLPEGPLFEVVVIHHTQCGAGAFADDGFRTTYAERIGVDPESLRDHAVIDPWLTVAQDVGRVRNAPSISPRIAVSGLVYDVTSGLAETVISVSAESPSTGAAGDQAGSQTP